jgi:hypothetical protein
MLEQEVLAGAQGADDAYGRQAALARSLAVMSAVGAALGLGDRHLNNILLDPRRCEVRASALRACRVWGGVGRGLARGKASSQMAQHLVFLTHTSVSLTLPPHPPNQVLHIDYNVCFERGARLKVPEVVPFRLTPSLVRALGPLGVDSGHFRSACEATLRVLRRRREMVLSMLEALALDPVVEWAGAGGETVGTESREAMEARVTLKLFVLRVGEVRALLQGRVAELEQGLAALRSLMRRLVSARALAADPAAAARLRGERVERVGQPEPPPDEVLAYAEHSMQDLAEEFEALAGEVEAAA